RDVPGAEGHAAGVPAAPRPNDDAGLPDQSGRHAHVLSAPPGPGSNAERQPGASFSIRTLSGGKGSASEYGGPCKGVGSAQAPPALPRLLPPYTPASLLSSSR